MGDDEEAVDPNSRPVNQESRVALARKPGRPGRTIRYLVSIAPEQVIEALREQPDVYTLTAADRRELSDVVTHRRIVAVPGRNEFRAYVATPPAGEREGVGFMGRLCMRAGLQKTPEGTVVEVSFQHARSAQATLRWLGFLATTLAGAAWVLLGGSDLGQRGLLFATFLVFTLPVLAFDVVRVRSTEREQLELLNILQRILGPVSIGDTPGERTPFRRPRSLTGHVK